MNAPSIERSASCMSPADTALVVIDVQEKLLPQIESAERLVWNVCRLIDAARLLRVPVLATEQYPQGLGPTAPAIAERVESPVAKRSFSCYGAAPFRAALEQHDVAKVLLVGIEAHVCVQQTALDLLADGWSVFVAADAVGSRYQIDYEFAMRRLEMAGCTLTTTEAAMFEWCQTSAVDEFRQISVLVRQAPPP